MGHPVEIPVVYLPAASTEKNTLKDQLKVEDTVNVRNAGRFAFPSAYYRLLL